MYLLRLLEAFFGFSLCPFRDDLHGVELVIPNVLGDVVVDEISDGSASPDRQPDLGRTDVVPHVNEHEVNVLLKMGTKKRRRSK